MLSLSLSSCSSLSLCASICLLSRFLDSGSTPIASDINTSLFYLSDRCLGAAPTRRARSRRLGPGVAPGLAMQRKQMTEHQNSLSGEHPLCPLPLSLSSDAEAYAESHLYMTDVCQSGALAPRPRPKPAAGGAATGVPPASPPASQRRPIKNKQCQQTGIQTESQAHTQAYKHAQTDTQHTQRNGRLRARARACTFRTCCGRLRFLALIITQDLLLI